MKRTKYVCALLLIGALSGCDVPPPSQSAPKAQAGDEQDRADVAPAASEGAGTKASDQAIQSVHRSVVAVDHMPFAEPPRLVLTLAGSGWDEAGVFYGFAIDAAAVIKAMQKKGLVPDDEDFVFILRADGTDGVARNILHLQVPKNVLTATAPSPAALLENSDVIYNGPMGRAVGTAFCNSSVYQGGAGMLNVPQFCGKALVPR